MNNLRKIGLIFVGACLVLIQSMVVADYTFAQGGLPPRPSSAGGSGGSDGSGGGNGKGDDHDSIILGDITGYVIDQSTGLPGAGLTVMVNDIPIKTDASGHFSLTGIADGPYLVDLSLPSELSPAQSRQTVFVVNRNKVEINLGYYSSTPPVNVGTAEPVPEVMAQAESAQLEAGNLVTSPQAMPETGGISSLGLFAFFIYVLGIGVWTYGMVQFLLWVTP